MKTFHLVRILRKSEHEQSSFARKALGFMHENLQKSYTYAATCIICMSLTIVIKSCKFSKYGDAYDLKSDNQLRFKRIVSYSSRSLGILVTSIMLCNIFQHRR